MLRNYSVDQVPINGLSALSTQRMIDMDDGAIVAQAHIMPPETLSLRAGEYGLDPNNTELLLDVVTYEAFIVYPEDAHPLWTAGSIAEAREHHLDMISTAHRIQEARGVDVPRPKDYPTKAVHRAVRARQAELAPVRGHLVDQGRAHARAIWQEIQRYGTASPRPRTMMPGRG